METNALKIVMDFEEEYMSNVQQYTLKELADKFDMELKTSCDNVDLIDVINRCMFADLFRHEPFLECPVLGYYIINGEHCFAFAELGKVYCKECKEEHPVYQAITFSDESYGCKKIIGYEEDIADDPSMHTFYDVEHYLFINTSAIDAAGLL